MKLKAVLVVLATVLMAAVAQASVGPNLTKDLLTLAGTTTGSSGQFNGNIFVTAVPEPGEWAMMFAGLGLVGVIARRRTRV